MRQKLWKQPPRKGLLFSSWNINIIAKGQKFWLGEKKKTVIEFGDYSFLCSLYWIVPSSDTWNLTKFCFSELNTSSNLRLLWSLLRIDILCH